MTNLKLKKYDGALISIIPGEPLALEETREYEIVFDGEVESCQVYFGSAPLEPDSKGCLSIRPGYWVGDTELRIDWADESLSVPVRVQPRKEKLPDTLWVAMLQDLESWLPGVSVGIEGGKSGQVGTSGVSVPFIAEALIPLITTFEKAIRALLETPRSLDVSIWEDVPLRMVRRVDRETLNWVSRHPEFGVHLDPWKSLESIDQQPWLPQRKTIDVLDHPANRYISWLVRRVERVLKITAEGLIAASNNNATDDNVFWSHSRAKRLRDGADRLLSLWRTSFLKEVPREPLTEAALQVIFDDPGYTRVHKIGRLFLNPFFQFDLDANKLQAAVRPSFTIYELWCFLAVSDQLKKAFSDWKWASVGLQKLLDPLASGEGAVCRAAGPAGEVIETRFNATFSSYFSRKGKARWSISGERRPDIIVSYKPEEGEGRWVSLDAKYRVGRSNLADAFSSVHIYRDALRYEGYSGPCQASVLLSPATSDDTAEWFSQEFLETYDEGIWEIKPGLENYEVGTWLIDTLIDNPKESG